MALGWAIFLVLVGGVLLLVEPTGSAEFVASVLTVGLGVLLGALAVGAMALMHRLVRRSARASDTHARASDSVSNGRDR